MYNTNTNTYTVMDIRKTFEGCEADIRTIARRTGKWTMNYVDKIFYDILKLTENKYLKSVDIALVNISNDEVIRAAKFQVNENGTANSGDRAGNNNDWDNLPNTRLTVILSYNESWYKLSEDEKQSFYSNNNFKINWVTTSIDNSFPHLNSNQGQLYASNNYELQKTNYK